MNWSATGMALWNRARARVIALGLAAMALTGCASDHTAALFGQYLYETAFAGSRAAYTREQVANLPYATIGLGLGSARKQIIVLESLDGRNHRWLTGDPFAIVTRGGRVLNTAGLPDDLTATRLPGPDPVDGQLHQLNGPVDAIRIIDFRADRVFEQRVDCRFKPAGTDTIEILGIERALRKVKERCFAKRIHWRFTNFYWVDPVDGRVWRSRQHVHPRMPALTIDVLRPSSVQ